MFFNIFYFSRIFYKIFLLLEGNMKLGLKKYQGKVKRNVLEVNYKVIRENLIFIDWMVWIGRIYVCFYKEVFIKEKF